MKISTMKRILDIISNDGKLTLEDDWWSFDPTFISIVPEQSVEKTNEDLSKIEQIAKETGEFTVKLSAKANKIIIILKA